MSSAAFLNIAAIVLICAQIVAPSTASQQAKEVFAEEAVVVPLPDGLVLVHFEFTQQAAHRRHFTLFPKAVGQLAAAIPFQSLELSLTQGRWHQHRWGPPLLEAKPAGAELRADFSPLLPVDALPSLWGNLSHALGGLFCASLNFVARAEATAPLTISMQAVHQGPRHEQHQQQQQVSDAGPIWVPAATAQHVLYAALPQEASCTENLTPWLKLLPCRDAAGLGRLLTQRTVVFGADYHSLQVKIHVERNQQQQPIRTTLRQSFTMVLRAPLQHDGGLSSARHPPKPGTLSDVDLSSLLASTVPAACPVAGTSRLFLQLPPAQHLLRAAELLQPPAYIPVSTSALAGTDEAEPDGGSSSSSSSSRSAVSIERQATWSTAAFSLSPAPDAAAVLRRAHCGFSTAPVATSQDRSTGSTAASCSSRLLYMYDLHHNQPSMASTGEQTAADTVLPFNLTWEQHHVLDVDVTSGAAEVGSLPQFQVARYITGTGNLHGGMVLHLTATQPVGTVAARNISVCIFQVVPWYVRLWLHTLQLSVDGQPTALEDVLLLSYISPAQDRVRPLVLDLCLSVPASVHSIGLTAQFTKAFLRMLEHPPDAHRGFDVPAAIITVGHAPAVQPNNLSHSLGDSGIPSESSQQPSSSSSSSSHEVDASSAGSSWQVIVAEGAPHAAQLQAVSPLMELLLQQRPPVVYSPGLVVPLAVPDFSMPYNVICLTSTVLAIFVGGVLNALLWRPGKDERDAADAKLAALRKRKKAVRLVLLVVAFVTVAVYFDADLQAELLKQAQLLGLYKAPNDEV